MSSSSSEEDRISSATVNRAVDITHEIDDISLRPVGFGGYSDIYTGMWRSTAGDMKVAIKVIRAAPTDGSDLMPRALRREISVWKRLQHRNIHVMCGLFEGIGPMPAPVSPWYRNGDIKSYLRRFVDDPDIEFLKLRLCCDIMCGVKFLHSNSIVHGDIKGLNVLISDTGVARLCDFGLSRLLVEHSQSVTYTGMRGTARWMAPEIFLDGEQHSFASDVWACGCLFIEVWNHVTPYHTKVNDHQFSLALGGKELPGSQADMPDMIWTFVQECCSFDATQRPASLQVAARLCLQLVLHRVNYWLTPGRNRSIGALATDLSRGMEANLQAVGLQDMTECYFLADKELAYGVILPASVSFLGADDDDHFGRFPRSHKPAKLPPLGGSMPLPQSPQATDPPSEPPLRAPNARFKLAVQTVILMQSAPAARLQLENPWPKTTFSTSPGRNNSTFFKPLTTGRLTHVTELKVALQKVEPVQRGMIHQALVRNLAFSPNGRFLATCSWDSTSAIVDVENMTVHRVLGHPNGFVGQVVWSPNGHHLLTKLTSGINVWTEEGVRIQRINRRTAVQRIAWFPSGKEFLSVEGNALVHMDLKGNVIGLHVIKQAQMHDVAILNDGQRFLAVATLEQTNDGRKLSKAHAGKHILVYERIGKVLEMQVPVLQDVRHISLTRDNNFAIFSCDLKSPPQLWNVDIGADHARLNLRLTYAPRKDTDFTGPSYFGGRNDQFVICASKAGDIHIWHRETGVLLRHVLAQSLTCIAWNDNAKTDMFATGSNEGSVLLWQAVEERTAQ